MQKLRLSITGFVFAAAAISIGQFLDLGWRPAIAQTNAVSVRFDRASVMIESASGLHKFDVEVARTPKQQSVGLMFRQRMGRDAGMLFPQAGAQVINMWMQNTYIPLDMIFIDPAGRISKIAERTVPESKSVISSGTPIIAVLELNGGTASRLKIAVGDQVSSPALNFQR